MTLPAPGTYPFPAVHLNGTGRETLEREYREAARALRKAQDAFTATTCHPRDYYVLADGSFSRAQDARQQAAQALQNVAEYLDAHLIHLHRKDP